MADDDVMVSVLKITIAVSHGSGSGVISSPLADPAPWVGGVSQWRERVNVRV